MGGGGTDVVERTTTAAPQPTVVPELQPYIQSMGQYAQQMLNLPGTTPLRFANDQPIPVPGFSPLQQQALGMIQQRTTQGLPVPYAEMYNQQALMGLPGQVSNPISLSPYTYQGLNTASMIPYAAGPTGYENYGAGVMGQFAGQGGFNENSPAIQNALGNLENVISPTIKNQLATQGLANSGEVARQVGQAYAGQLTPLYMQGLQQSQQAAQQLAGLGGAQAQRQMGGLQAYQQAQQGVGQQQQAANTEALSRQMYSTLSGAPTIQQIGLRQEQRPLDQIQQALQGGEQQRSLELQQQQAVLDSYTRAREIALGLMNPLGSFGAVSYTPSSQVNRQTSPQGFGFGK